MESIDTIRTCLHFTGILLLLLVGGFLVYLRRFWRDDEKQD
jgi:hypothetical protein